MPSLLDLPDEVLFILGEQFEDDASNLGLFLLIHPQINAACAVLRYRTKYVRFDSESPLQDYLQHKLWLRNVHSIMIFAACYQRIPKEGYVGRLGFAIKEPEQYDRDLAKVIASLTSVKVVRIEVPYLPPNVPDRPAIPLKRTFEAIKAHHEIKEVRLQSSRTEEHLQSALDLAEALPKCSILELVQNYDTDIKADMVTPLAKYLSKPLVAGRLETLYLREFSMSTFEYTAQAIQTLDINALSSLKNFYVQDAWLWHNDEREDEVLLLREVLLKAIKLVRLDMNAMALHALAVHRLNTTATTLHILCGTEDLASLDALLGAIPSSVHSLILSGPEANRCAKALLTGDEKASGMRVGSLKKLTIIEASDGDEMGIREELKGLGEKHRISLDHTPKFSHPIANHARMANPVNPKNWAPRPLQLQPGLLMLSSGSDP